MLIKLKDHLFDLGIWKSVEFDVPTYYVGSIGKEKSLEISICIQQILNRNNVKCAIHVKPDFVKGNFSINEEQSHLYYSSLINNTSEGYKGIFSSQDKILGMSEFLQFNEGTACILFDDAYSINEIRPHVRILISSYNLLFTKDKIAPMGALKDRVINANKADAILIVDCPFHSTDDSFEKRISEEINADCPIFLLRSSTNNNDSDKSSDRIEFIKDRDNFERLILNGLNKVESN